MTVIAYSAKHKIVATDSRLSDSEGMHVTTCKKLFRLKTGALLGTAGDSDDRDVRALLSKANPNRMPSRAALADLQCRFQGILVFPGGAAFMIAIWYRGEEHEWTGSVDPIVDPFIAVGCGAEIAYGAMAAGMTPQRAVELTCERHSLCAPPVQWEKLR